MSSLKKSNRHLNCSTETATSRLTERSWERCSVPSVSTTPSRRSSRWFARLTPTRMIRLTSMNFCNSCGNGCATLTRRRSWSRRSKSLIAMETVWSPSLNLRWSWSRLEKISTMHSVNQLSNQVIATMMENSTTTSSLEWWSTPQTTRTRTREYKGEIAMTELPCNNSKYYRYRRYITLIRKVDTLHIKTNNEKLILRV